MPLSDDSGSARGLFRLQQLAEVPRQPVHQRAVPRGVVGLVSDDLAGGREPGSHHGTLIRGLEVFVPRQLRDRTGTSLHSSCRLPTGLPTELTGGPFREGPGMRGRGPTEDSCLKQRASNRSEKSRDPTACSHGAPLRCQSPSNGFMLMAIEDAAAWPPRGSGHYGPMLRTEAEGGLLVPRTVETDAGGRDLGDCQ